jgi:DNA polymerase-4
VSRRLRGAGVHARTITLKARYGDFSTVTRTRTLRAPTALSTVVLATARELLAGIDVERGLRLVGVSASQLAPPPPEQAVLAVELPVPGADPDRREAVERAVHAVRERFGDTSISPAALAPSREERGA